MPKRRATIVGPYTGVVSGGASYPSGGSAGSGGAGGGGRAVSFSPPPTVTVEVLSRTRGRIESVGVSFVEPERAYVSSQSGNVYEVRLGDSPSCTCPDFSVRHRGEEGYRCHHILGALRASGVDVPASEMEAATQARVPLTNRTAFDASQAAREMAEQRAEESSIPVPPVGEHEVSLEDDEAFRALLERAQRGDVPYEYENVLNDPNITFGVEIEFEGGDRQAIARELYERGLIPEPRQKSYHSTRTPGMWSFETDGSVDGEIVSPVFRDTPEAWRQIEEVCEIVRRHGGMAVSRRKSIGGHVHVGRTPLDHDRTRFNNLMALCRSNEDLLFRIASGGESGGQHRGTRYVRPLAEGFGESSHYVAVNMRNPRTVEFRYFNGSLDPRQIQTNVKLSCALVNAAGRMRQPEQAENLGSAPYHSISGDRARAEEQTHGSVRRFLDRLFTRAQDKLSVLWLYATSRWQHA